MRVGKAGRIGRGTVCSLLIGLLLAQSWLSKADAEIGKPHNGSTQMEKKHVANRLVSEKSPYLLQHADNPVDWYPWTTEAFEKAKEDDKPIFLSIGYSTCHWCHVMAHESFEDSAVARLMNETFVSIKVDREERPDIDGVYMTVCQMLTGSGGWPLTILMTPDKRPFFAGTYIPKASTFGRLGMMELIPRVNELWKADREGLLKSAEEITTSLQQIGPYQSSEELDETILKQAFQALSLTYDKNRGGFGSRPKFPTPHHLTFLLRYWRRTGEPRALEMVETTLQAMRRGGIYDHVGYGFHRYSTDDQWLLPHFEKMLYDQALLAIAYVEAFQATGKKEYARTAQEIFTYVLRDMRSPEGGFFSAEDADSEGEEGRFYVWHKKELIEVLGEQDGEFASRVFGVREAGNFKEEATGDRTGANILHLEMPLPVLADELGLDSEALAIRVESIRERLFDTRKERVRPQLDDKVLSDWNGLMIAALAKAARAFGESSYASEAAYASDFILSRMRIEKGDLLHRYRDGEAGLHASIDDYAFMVWGLLELYETTFEPDYLKQALELTTVQIDRFWDEENGGFYFTSGSSESLLIRQKEIYDGAIPSGNSIAMLNMLRLARMTSDPDLEEQANQIGKAFAHVVRRSPAGYTQLLSAVDFAAGPSYEVVIAGEPNGEDTEAMIRALSERFLPSAVVIFRAPDKGTPTDALTGTNQGHTLANGKATAYVCQNFMCSLPTNNVDKMIELLEAESHR